MKRTVPFILILALLFSLFSCDISHLCALEVISFNKSASIVVEGDAFESFSFSSEEMNHQPLERYENIDFTAEDNTSNAKVHKFGIASETGGAYRLGMSLVDANKHVIDFLRIGILIDGEVKVYQDYDKYEDIYGREQNSAQVLFFNSDSEVFNNITVDIPAGEVKEVTVFIWIEESELYDRNGNRYTGWADKSYKASPIVLNLEIN